jgi:hypothetical protein
LWGTKHSLGTFVLAFGQLRPARFC